MTARLAIFLSGSGRTLVNLLERIDAGDVPAEVALVVASRECRGAELARESGIDTRVISGNVSAETVEQLLTESRAEYAALAGYLRLLGVPASCRGRMVNIHPALLPSFGGAGMYGDRVHQAVLDAGCKVSGCTVHFCDDRYDTGPIIAQQCCPVFDDDTASSLAARVFALEMELYPAVIRTLVEGRIHVLGRSTRTAPPAASGPL